MRDQTVRGWICRSRKTILRDFLISLSLVNLFHLSAWQDINRAYSPSLNYFRSAPPSLVFLGGLVLTEFALSIGLLAVTTCVRLCASRGLTVFAQWCFLAALALTVDIGRRQFVYATVWISHPAQINGALIALEVLFLLGGCLLIFRIDLMLKVGTGIALALSPLIFISTLSLILSVPPKPAFAVKLARSAGASSTHQTRILWFIFDELDQCFCFDLRPGSVKMPELDRLSRQSLVASRAHAPGIDTMPSLISLISGRNVDDTRAAGESDLLVRFRSSSSFESWSQQPNIFAEVGRMGFQPGLVGWFHPYARIFPGVFFDAAWRPNVDASGLMLRQECAADSGIGAAIGNQLVRDSLLLPLSQRVRGRLESRLATAETDFLRRSNRDDLVWLRQRTLEMAVDPRISFLFAHLPIPHPLGVYDRHTGKYSLDPGSNYFDNLALVDSRIGELRESMERAGMWDGTVLLISSDHGLRPRIWKNRPSWTREEETAARFASEDHVPFLLKLGYQREGAAFEREFNAMISHDLILAICHGQITTVQDAAGWLARRAAQPDAPPLH